MNILEVTALYMFVGWACALRMGVGSIFPHFAQIIAIFWSLLGNHKGIDKVCTFTLACLVRNIWGYLPSFRSLKNRIDSFTGLDPSRNPFNSTASLKYIKITAMKDFGTYVACPIAYIFHRFCGTLGSYETFHESAISCSGHALTQCHVRHSVNEKIDCLTTS